MDPFAAVRLVIGAAFLTVAAFLDLQDRRVPDPVWIALGSVAFVVLAVDVATSYYGWNQWLLIGSAAIFFYAVFYGKPILDEDGAHARPFRLLVLAAAAVAWFAGVFLPNPVDRMYLPFGARVIPVAGLATVSVMVLLYQLFYQLGLLRGGADAKAMMALTLLVPLYPEASPFPLIVLPGSLQSAMQVLFPFSLTVLVDAAILFLAVPLVYLLVNAWRREVELPQAFFGTKADLDHLPRHVWLMERVDRDGERIAVLFPSRLMDQDEEVTKLKAAGADRVWIQPKLPFMVPLLAGFLLAFLVGNLMLGFLTAVLPHP